MAEVSNTHTSVKISKSFEDSASSFSRFFLSFLNPLFAIGNKRTLNHEDLGTVSEQDKSLKLYESFLFFWNKEQNLPAEKRSLWMVLWRTTSWMRISQSLGYYALGSAISYGPIIILNNLVLYFEGGRDLTVTTVWILVALMFVLPMSSSLFLAQSNVIMAHIGIQFRNCLVNMIYRKALRLSPASRQQQSTGMIVNMFSNDTKQLQNFLFFFNNMVIAPFQIIACIVLIYLQVGPATFVGLALMIISMPMNVFIFLSLNAVRQKKVVKTDIRVKLMNEILSGIRVIKYYAWEQAFEKNITAVRWEELLLLKQMAYIIAFGFTTILFLLPLVQPILIFYTYVKLGNQLTAAVAFTTISFFNMLQFPFAFLPMGISQYSQSLVSTRRMLKFFVSEELDPYVTNEDRGDKIAIETKNLCICWVKEVLPAEESADSAVVVAPSTTSSVVAASGAGDASVGGGVDKHASDVLSSSVSHYDEEKNGSDVRVSAANAAGGYHPVSTITATEDVAAADLVEIDLATASERKAEEPIDTDASALNKENILTVTSINRSSQTLRDINVSIEKGSLVAVVGMVGSGKTSFLNALLGEMHLQAGSVNVVGSIAYCEQRPWILNATVEQNILFGEPMNQKLFDAAIHAACLEDDIKVLPGGILTEIGERGINLSGGQKARIALARAVYKRADLYLLDDPLSAVDAHVGQHIFKHCIRNTLKGTTRILVTHHVHLLNQCDKIIILDDGMVKAQGSYEDLQKSGVDISAFVPFYESDDESEGSMTEYDSELWSGSDSGSDTDSPSDQDDKDTWKDSKHNDVAVSSSPTPESIEESKTEEYSSPVTAIGIPSSAIVDVTAEKETDSAPVVPVPATTSISIMSVSEEQAEQKAKTDADERHLDNREATKIISVEERETGDVSPSVYSYYIRAGGIWLFSLVIFALLCTQAAQIVAQFFLASWGDRTANTAGGLTTDQNLEELSTYAWLSMLPVVFILIRSIGLANHRLGTSEKLHKDVLYRILRAPVAFFDITPIGRILNRFSSDMLTVDEELSQTITQLSNSVFQCLGAVAAVAGATKGTFLVLMVPLAYFYYVIQKMFRKTNTAIARLEAVSRSPIYTDFSQALVGAISIRAYKEQQRFIDKLEVCVDSNSVAAVTQQLCSNWLAIRLDFFGACITFFIALIAVATNGSFMPAGFLALGLTNSFQITTYLKFAVRMMATGEAQMNSVERLKLYAEQVPQECNDVTKPQLDESEIPPDWPVKGEVKFNDLHMSYRDGPAVLKGLSFNVRGGMKVGIAGRTGAGKSSLMIALFRIQELTKGSITIDGIDTSSIPLQLLRSKLGIIPQDPVMFSATVRFNLDPFNEHTDLEIWNVLESVDMKNYISSMEKGLEEEVSEGGDNFSAGQRQLICISRALLRKPKILVLDEATASIDNETDALIQRTVRSSFKDCTVLTIAHRLHTIIDSDRIMVLDQGTLAEWGPPVELLEKPVETGVFRSLWDKHQQSHEQQDYPEYHLKDEIAIKRTVKRSESSMRHMGKSKSSHRFGRSQSSNLKSSNSGDQNDRPHRSGSHRHHKSETEGDSGLARSGSSFKKSRRSLTGQSKSMRDSITSIKEEDEEDAKKEEKEISSMTNEASVKSRRSIIDQNSARDSITAIKEEQEEDFKKEDEGK